MSRPAVVAAALAGALGAAGVALAASLGVTSAHLTTWSGAGGVPVSSCTLSSVADASLDAGSPGSNLGGQTTMEVETHRNKPVRSIVRFDVASCVPPGARVLSARLRLVLVGAPTQSRTYEAYRATGSWAETTVTWSTQPGYAAAATASTATGTTDGVPLAWDVLADVQAYADGTENHGWRVSDANETESGPSRTGLLGAREAASGGPELAITFYP